MKLATLATLAITLPLAAQAQDTLHSSTSADSPLLTSIDVEQMRDIVSSEGHVAGDNLTSGVGIMATDENGLTYILNGKACEETTCLGLEIMVAFNGDYSPEFANSINQRWSAIKATQTESALLLSRYLILDGGQTKENLAINVRNTIAIAEAVQADSASIESPAPPAPQPEILSVADFDWGDDTGDYANDGACDDARFHEDGDDWSYQRSHVTRDATDCRTLYEQGEITLYLDFGSNGVDYVDDNTCDDNRFTGEGRSILQTDSQVKRDAADCISAYQADTINRPS